MQNLGVPRISEIIGDFVLHFHFLTKSHTDGTRISQFILYGQYIVSSYLSVRMSPVDVLFSINRKSLWSKECTIHLH